MMFLLAGIKDISQELFESAKIDGASYWVTTFRITIPLLKRPLAFVIIADTTSNPVSYTHLDVYKRQAPYPGITLARCFSPTNIINNFSRGLIGTIVNVLCVFVYLHHTWGIIIEVAFWFCEKGGHIANGRGFSSDSGYANAGKNQYKG